MSGILAGLRNAIRPSGAVRNGGDDILIAVGCGVARQRDRDLFLRDGDALLATRDVTGITIARPTLTRIPNSNRLY